MMMICYSCKKEITVDKRSSEHIIPNSIGGVLKSDKLLCRACNSKFGETIDKDLASSYEYLVSLLGLKRDRPKDYTIKNLQNSNGERYHLLDGKIPTPVKPKIKVEGEKITIIARNKKQLGQILDGQSRKYPALKNVDLSALPENKNQYLKDKLSLLFTVGGNGIFLSVGKMAVDFFIHHCGYVACLEEIIEVIAGHKPNDNHIHHFPIVDSLKINKEEVFHSIHIQSNPASDLLYAYVVLFCANGFIVNLSETYTGPNIDLQYCYDVLGNREFDRPVHVEYAGRMAFNVERDRNEAIIHERNIQSIQRHLSRLMQIVDARHTKYSRDKILQESMQEVLAKHGNPKTITQEVLDDYLETASFRLAVFIDHLANRS